jgi:hypothetical protein
MADSERPSRDPIYRLIVALMAADIVVGLALAAVGWFVLEKSEMVLVGTGLALIGALLLFFFQGRAQRASRRQDQD